MKGSLTIAFILVLQVTFEHSFAQAKFTLVKGPEGRPTGKITSITQDRYGYMWFGGQVQQTLLRFDGSHWISFGIDADNPNSLKATTLEKIYADVSGMIWIGGNGLDQLNPTTRIFKHFRHDDKDPGSLASDAVFAILKDRQGRLWVGTDNGLDRLEEKTGKFIHYRHEPGNVTSLSSNFVREIYEDRNGDIWIGTGNPFTDDLEIGGLNRLDSGYTFTRYLHDPGNLHSLGNNKVRSIFEDSRGEFWIGTGRNGLYSMDRKTGHFELRKFTSDSNDDQSRTTTKPDEWKQIHEQVSFICEDNRGQLWTGSMWSGIRCYDIASKKFTLYKSGSDFPDSSGWTGYISKDGVLWVGTEDSYLLYKAGPFLNKIPSIHTGSNGRDFIEEKNKILWVSTNKGLLQFDLQQRMSIQPRSVLHPERLFDKNIISLALTGTDTVWLGTDSSVGVLNTKTQQLSTFSLGLTGRSNEPHGIWDIFKDKKNNIWFATEEGAIIFHPTDGSITRYQHNEKDTTSIMGNRITSILEDRNGDIWIANVGGGREGINRLNKVSDHFRHYLKNYACIFLYEDTNGTIWACTLKGLFQYNAKTDRFSSFFDAQPFYDTIASLVEDNQKNLWFTTPSVFGQESALVQFSFQFIC